MFGKGCHLWFLEPSPENRCLKRGKIRLPELRLKYLAGLLRAHVLKKRNREGQIDKSSTRMTPRHGPAVYRFAAKFPRLGRTRREAMLCGTIFLTENHLPFPVFPVSALLYTKKKVN